MLKDKTVCVGDYGSIVKVPYGWRGNVLGEYDDDTVNEEGVDCALIYPLRASISGCFEIPHDELILLEKVR